MSRPIKFRAWNKQRSQWFPIKNALCLVINPESTDLVFMTDKGPYPLPDTGQEDGGVNRFVLEQFTGLLDKNGVEIYEGDFLAVGGKSYAPLSVRYRDDVAAFSLGNHPTGPCFRADLHVFVDVTNSRTNLTLEVIGNLHDNPDLLKP